MIRKTIKQKREFVENLMVLSLKPFPESFKDF